MTRFYGNRGYNEHPCGIGNHIHYRNAISQHNERWLYREESHGARTHKRREEHQHPLTRTNYQEQHRLAHGNNGLPQPPPFATQPIYIQDDKKWIRETSPLRLQIGLVATNESQQLSLEALKNWIVEELKQLKELNSILSLQRKEINKSTFFDRLLQPTHTTEFKLELLKYNTTKGDLVNHVWEFENKLLLH